MSVQAIVDSTQGNRLSGNTEVRLPAVVILAERSYPLVASEGDERRFSSKFPESQQMHLYLEALL